MSENNKIEYEKYCAILDKNDSLLILRGLIKLSEDFRKENFLKWVKDNPNYWHSIYSDNKELTQEYATKVMESLINSNIIELQLIWLYKCKEHNIIFDIFPFTG